MEKNIHSAEDLTLASGQDRGNKNNGIQEENNMTQKIIQFPKTDLYSSLSAIGTENSKYVAAVTAIEKTMVTLSDMEMPSKSDFANIPQTYDEIARCYKGIQSLAIEFTTKIYNELEQYPDACITSLESIDDSLEKALEKVDFILENPDLNEQELSHEVKMLTRYMDSVAEEADEQIKDLNILINNLEKFREQSVLAIKTMMNTILDDIKIETTEYQNAVKALEKAKKELEKEVNEQITVLVAAVVGTIVSVVISAFTLIATIASGGALAIGVAAVAGLIGVGGGLLGIGFSAYELDSTLKELDYTVAKLSGYEADVLLFSEWHDEVDKCAKQLVGIKENLLTVQDSWMIVKNGFRSISAKIKKAKGDLSSEEWQNLKSVFVSCQETSAKTKAMLESMKLEDNLIADSQLQEGMTKEQVEEALKNANLLTFKEYMLAI